MVQGEPYLIQNGAIYKSWTDCALFKCQRKSDRDKDTYVYLSLHGALVKLIIKFLADLPAFCTGRAIFDTKFSNMWSNVGPVQFIFKLWSNIY